MTGKKRGYQRVSTEDQKLHLQTDALQAAGCEEIFSDVSSGTKADREGLQQVLEQLQEGDCLVVWKLDRLARSLRQLIEVITSLEQRGIGFISLQENINTTTPGGRLIFHIFGALAEFELQIIKTRTMSGLAAAKARGKVGGRPRALSDKQLEILRTLKADHSLSVSQICAMLNVSRTTYYRAA